MYDIGFGSQIIGALSSKIANQYIMLNGEGGTDLVCPNSLTLPDSIHQPAAIAIMNVEQFSAKLKKK